MFDVNFELNMSKPDLQEVVDNFADQISGLLDKIGGDRKGLMLVLDDFDALAEHAEFAHWLQCMRDRMEVSGRKGPPVFLFLSGLEERRRQLIAHNEAVARIFQPTLLVERWTDKESRMFFEDGFKKAEVELLDGDLEDCVDFAGGLPALAQKIGHGVWLCARKGEGAFSGIVDAAESIGRQCLETSVVQALLQDRYRAILRKAGRNFPVSETFSKRDLRARLNLSDDEKRALDNFINHMCKLKIISPDRESGERGVYRFPSLLHGFYFSIMAMENERGGRKG